MSDDETLRYLKVLKRQIKLFGLDHVLLMMAELQDMQDKELTELKDKIDKLHY